MTSRSAAEAVEWACRQIGYGRDFVVSQVPVAQRYFDDYVAQATTGVPAKLAGDISYIRALRRLPVEVMHEVAFTASDVGTLALWGRNRITYAIDPALWSELADMDMDAPIAPDVFTHLPHPDPFIALPNPIAMPIPGEPRLQKIVGFFVTGSEQIDQERAAAGAYAQVSTHSPKATALGLLFACEILDAETGEPFKTGAGIDDTWWTRVTLDPHAGSLRQMIATSAERFVPYAHHTDATANWREDLALMMQAAVAALIYLGAVNADLRPLPVPPKRAGRHGGRTVRDESRPRTVQVGYRVGEALRAYRQREGAVRVDDDGRRSMAPHVRRAHFHTYRVGPGRRLSEVRWVSPVEVNMNGPASRTSVKRLSGKSCRTL